jgi:hypothetical protein
MTVTWHGSAAEYRDLVRGVGHNCCCENGMGVRTCCSAHHMINEDQRALDGLLFARRMADRLRREEWMEIPKEVAAPSGVFHQATRIQDRLHGMRSTQVWDSSHVFLASSGHPVANT